MSLDRGVPHPFLSYLHGRTTTFLLEGRQANLAFAKTVIGLLSQARTPCAILDLDAFYSSNSDRIFSQMDPASAASSIVWVPRPGSEIELELSDLFQVQQKVVIIDSLNSLYHLVALGDGSSRSRKLTFALASLSYLARTNGKTVILTMYRREGFYRGVTGRAISDLSDATASVIITNGELKVNIERGPAMAGRSLL